MNTCKKCIKISFNYSSCLSDLPYRLCLAASRFDCVLIFFRDVLPSDGIIFWSSMLFKLFSNTKIILTLTPYLCHNVQKTTKTKQETVGFTRGRHVTPHSYWLTWTCRRLNLNSARTCRFLHLDLLFYTK